MVGEQKIIKLSLQVRLADRIAAHERDDLHAGGFGVLRCHTAGNGRIQTGRVKKDFHQMKLLHSYGSDVRVHTFVPVQEAFHINSVTDL